MFTYANAFPKLEYVWEYREYGTGSHKNVILKTVNLIRLEMCFMSPVWRSPVLLCLLGGMQRPWKAMRTKEIMACAAT